MKHAAAEKHEISRTPYIDLPREESKFDSGSGQGTIDRWPPGKTMEHPILDGATSAPQAEHDVENPWRGLDDPALIVHPERSRRRKWHWFWE